MHLLIDLDGTITDPFVGITRSIQHALASMGRPSPRADDLRWCIGPPLRESFSALLGTDDPELAETALSKYRERYSEIGLFENAVYPGMEPALATLCALGHRLYVCTAKPTVYSERIIRHFQLQGYFIAVHGCELDGTRDDKADLITHIVRTHGIDRAEAAMIGDREYDMIAAKKSGMAGIGVLWGYGIPEELVAAGALTCIREPSALPGAVGTLGYIGEGACDI